jgi:hypothetical protein
MHGTKMYKLLSFDKLYMCVCACVQSIYIYIYKYTNRDFKIWNISVTVEISLISASIHCLPMTVHSLL